MGMRRGVLPRAELEGRAETMIEGQWTLAAVCEEKDILDTYRSTAVGDLLRCHNLGGTHGVYSAPQLLIATCMDFRIQLRIPTRFAFVLRTAGANVDRLQFDAAFAIGVAKVGAIAVIGHHECAMGDVTNRRDDFVNGLESHGWKRDRAEALFDANAPRIGFNCLEQRVVDQADHFREHFPDLLVAPLVYSVEDHKLYQVVGESD